MMIDHVDYSMFIWSLARLPKKSLALQNDDTVGVGILDNVAHLSVDNAVESCTKDSPTF